MVASFKPTFFMMLMLCVLFLLTIVLTTTTASEIPDTPQFIPTDDDDTTPPPSPKQFNITTRRLGDLVEHKPTSISIQAPRGADVEDKIIIYQREDGTTTLAMTAKQQCDICHTTIDTGVILLRRGVQLNRQPSHIKEQIIKKYGVSFLSTALYNDTTGKLLWNSEDMADEICERAMLQYKPHYTIGCHELLAEHHEKIWSPFNHIDILNDLFNDTSVLEYKLNFCHQTGKCVVGQGLTDDQLPCAENTPTNRTRCESCLELANDSRMVFKRLMTTIPNPENNQKLKKRCTMSPANFKGFTDTWCPSLPLRHFKTDSLHQFCTEFTQDNHDELYEIIKDGHNLHRLLKDPLNWEETLCTKVSSMCTIDEIHDLYQQWDNAADYDFNITQNKYQLHTSLQGHSKLLKDLEEEYYYTPKYMYGPDLSTMSDDEISSYKQRVKDAAKVDKILKRNEDIDLDDGYDENDEKRQELKNKKDDDNNDGSWDEGEIQAIPEEESTTDLSPDMGHHLLGKLSYVDETGVRIPNQLPSHVSREYKAKRHELIHSIKHQQSIEHYQKELDKLRQRADEFQGKRRVYALPDSMHISKRMSEILTHYLERLHQREQGKIAEQLIQDTYNKQLNEMKLFSENFEQNEYQQVYDFEDSDNNSIQNEVINDVIDNEIQNEAIINTNDDNNNNKKKNNNNKKNNKHDEL